MSAPPVAASTAAASAAGRSSSAEDPLLRVGISSCLLGERVRYDGGHKRDGFLVQTLGRYVEWFPVCPEVEVGMGTPRETIRLEGDPARPRLVAPRSGTDHTAAMEAWAAARLEEIATWDLHGYVLKRASPSCGLYRVKVYDPASGMPDAQGRGIFARLLAERLPLLPLEEEGRLHDPLLRETFVDRLFAHERWSRFLAAEPTPGGLVAFHTAHKLTVMAHSPDHYRRLGRLVAEAGSLPWEELRERYVRLFAEALEIRASRGRHANVLQHAIGFLKDRLGGDDKAELLAQVEEYRLGLVPLVVPVTLLRHHLRRHEVPEWITRQVYLNPYPRELMLRNHV